ncbi:MAG: hypothetical protein ACKVGZ_16875, partial [Alphaproteobacteria bacterium]
QMGQNAVVVSGMVPDQICRAKNSTSRYEQATVFTGKNCEMRYIIIENANDFSLRGSNTYLYCNQ